MAYSQIVKTGDGVTTQFTLNFALGYLKQSDVTCRVGSEVDGGGDPLFRSLTWIDDSLVQVAGAPAGDEVPLVFARTVDISALLNIFANGVSLVEVNLDNSFKQALMGVQQIADGRFGVYQQNLDMGNFQIKNVGAGSDPGDAVNKAQLDAISIVSGNVPIPAVGNIGQFLRATATSVFAWASLIYADISALITTNATDIRTRLGLGSAALMTGGIAANNLLQLNASAQIPALDGSLLTTMGTLVGIEYFPATGTYTKKAGDLFIIADLVGPGGGSGGLAATGAGQACASNGGGGGGFSRKKILNSALAATTAITIGAGGLAATAGANLGGTGTTTTFGALHSASGGVGGTGGIAASTGIIPLGIAAGGVGSGGDLNLPGGSGSCAVVISAVGSMSGSGGASALSPGAPAATTTTTTQLPIAGIGPGSGAAGGTQSVSQAAKVGAAGADGYCIVYRYR